MAGVRSREASSHRGSIRCRVDQISPSRTTFILLNPKQSLHGKQRGTSLLLVILVTGLEYAQRRLLLESSWTGTGEAGITLSDGMTSFMIEAAAVPDSPYGANVHALGNVGPRRTAPSSLSAPEWPWQLVVRLPFRE